MRFVLFVCAFCFYVYAFCLICIHIHIHLYVLTFVLSPFWCFCGIFFIIFFSLFSFFCFCYFVCFFFFFFFSHSFTHARFAYVLRSLLGLFLFVRYGLWSTLSVVFTPLELHSWILNLNCFRVLFIRNNSAHNTNGQEKRRATIKETDQALDENRGNTP